MFMKISILVNVCAAFALATGCANPAAAASVSGGYNIGAVYSTCHAQGQGSASLTEANPICGDWLRTGSMTISGSGQASYSALRATAYAGFSGVDPSPTTGSTLADTLGSASYQDMLTIDIVGRTGQTVDLVFTTAMDGITTTDAPTLLRLPMLMPS